MNKCLEALERLMANYYEMCQDLGDNDDQYQRCNLTSERATIENSLKALEIIKEKKVDVPLLIRCRNIEDYNGICIVNGSSPLTEEEWDLLTEVLL